MALVKFGAGIVGMSGKIGGTIFARNRYGSYARAGTKPINPNSPRQVKMRGIMATLSTRWAQTLTGAQRIGWDLYGSSVSMKNRLGESTFLTGFNHYLRCNSPIGDIGNAYIDAPPTIFELPEKDPTFACSISEATQVVTITFDDTADWCDELKGMIYIIQGYPQNAQRNFFAGPWKGRTAKMGSDIAPPTSPETFASIHVVAENQKTWLQARIGRADGRISEPFLCSVAVDS